MKTQHAGREIVRTLGIPDTVRYTVYGGAHSFTLAGSTHGTPGPVTLIIGDDQHYVSAASRFGDRLDLDFVKKWIDAEDEARALMASPNPEYIECPTCLSPRGKPCTQPTDLGRVTVKWHHSSRIEAVAP